ncbi:MAG TPA: DoxX family protein [Acidobacteriota bacterium]|nr:DoxX family protein [Acidobacteriota bacterium]
MDTLTGAGLLILRVALGGIFFAHGAQKLFGWFGGRGLSGHAGFLGSLGLRPARLLAVVSGLGEFLGGSGVLFGFLMPLPSAAIIGAMAVAIIKVHWPKGFWNHDGGIEYPLVLAILAFVIGLAGPGRLSLDRAFGVRLPEPSTFIVVLALTAVVVAWAVTRPAPRKQP